MTEGSEVSGAYLEPTASTLVSLQAHADPIVGTSSFVQERHQPEGPPATCAKQDPNKNRWHIQIS